MSEHDEQRTFFDWVRLNRWLAPNLEVRKAMKLCYSVPNGAHMGKAQAGKMVAEGMTKGILDVNLDWPIVIYDPKKHEPPQEDIKAGLRIEFKFGKNTLTKEQKEMKALLEEAGFKVAVCKSAQEGVRTVFKYLPFKVEDYQGLKEFLNEQGTFN